METAEKVAHTPGPWKVITRGNQTGTKSAIVVGGPQVGQPRICQFDWLGDVEESPANARLIAAAPDMLKALEALSELMEEGFLVRDTRGDSDSDWAIKAFPKLRKLALVTDAIRKARGL